MKPLKWNFIVVVCFWMAINNIITPINQCRWNTAIVFHQVLISLKFDHEQKKYKIHLRFNENLGVVYKIWHGNESLHTNDVLSIRRLSTASSAKEKKPLTPGSFHTQWRWYFQDDVGQWILFDKVGDDIDRQNILFLMFS